MTFAQRNALLAHIRRQAGNLLSHAILAADQQSLYQLLTLRPFLLKLQCCHMLKRFHLCRLQANNHALI